MADMQKYVIAAACSAGELSDEIVGYEQEGYEVVGGMTVTLMPNDRYSNPDNDMWYFACLMKLKDSLL